MFHDINNKRQDIKLHYLQFLGKFQTKTGYENVPETAPCHSEVGQL